MEKGRCEINWITESRLRVSNGSIALEFSKTNSDTTWNYIWIKNPQTASWHRMFNFGLDVVPREFAGIFISKNLLIDVRTADPESCEVIVRYDPPLVLYKDPRFTYNGSVEVGYHLKAGKPYFDLQVQIRSGDFAYVMPIINTLWVENPDLPRRILVPGQQIYFDQDVTVSLYKIPFILLYNQSPNTTPLILRFAEDNGFVWFKHGDSRYLPGQPYREYAIGQEYVPRKQYVDGYNDICWQMVPEFEVSENQLLPGARIAFMPFVDLSATGTSEKEEARNVTARLYEADRIHEILCGVLYQPSRRR